MPRVLLLAICLFTFLHAQQESPRPDQVYEQYREWLTLQPPELQRGAGVEKAYREYLAKTGLGTQAIEARLAIIRTQSGRQEVERWNRILTASKPAFNTSPNAFLVEMVQGRKPGKALDVGMGQGRNAIWLAQQGWETTGFDPAERAVAMAVDTAKKLGLTLHTHTVGEEQFDFGDNRWDLIVLSYAGGRESRDKVIRGLRPGGLLVLEAFHRDAAKGRPIGGGVVFDSAELPALFRSLRVVRYQEPMGIADFGRQRVRLVQFCAEKPVE